LTYINIQSLKFKTFLLFIFFFIFLIFFLFVFTFVIFNEFIKNETEKMDNYTSFISYIAGNHADDGFDKIVYPPENYLWDIIITDDKGNLLYISNEDIDKMSVEDKKFAKYPPIKNALTGNWGLNRIIANGEKYFTSSRFVIENDWIIVVQVPEKIIINNAIKLIIPVLIFILSIILFFILLYQALKNTVLKPVGILTDYINQFTDNRKLKINEYKKNDEIGAAVKAFENLTIERIKLEKEILEISENERKRIGRDLHDDLGQILTGISFQLVLLNQSLDIGNEELTEIASNISSLTKEAINKTKIIARGLCPVNLFVDNGLILSIEEFSKNISTTYNVKCNFYYDKEIVINNEVISTNLYHIILETINNSIKHSKCKKIEIRLIKNDENIKLFIEDDGKGFENFNTNGMGLKILKYRANLIGGTLEIKSKLNNGTKLYCNFTLGEEK